MGPSAGVKSAGISQSVRETGRDESQSVPSPENLFKTRDLELQIFEGSLPSCSPHSAGYTRTSVGSEKSARSFSDRSFFVDVRVACLCQSACFFSQDLEGLTEIFWPDIRRDVGPKTSSLG